jgi:hypothetical protein
LESKLKRQLDGAGSTLFSLTWKAKATPAGRPYSQLAASARRISDSECGSWPTPCANGFEVMDLELMQKRREECKAQQGNGNGFGLTLGQAAMLWASWPTPTRQDAASSGAAGYSTESGRHSGTTLTDAARTAWATPSARDFKSESATDAFNEKRWSHPRGKPLSAEVTLASWATPRASDANGTGAHGDGGMDMRTLAALVAPQMSLQELSPENRQARRGLPAAPLISGPLATGSPALTEKRGQLNPDFSRWLMGYPVEWLFAAPPSKAQARFKSTGIPALEHSERSETRSSRKSRQSS